MDVNRCEYRSTAHILCMQYSNGNRMKSDIYRIIIFFCDSEREKAPCATPTAVNPLQNTIQFANKI